MEHVVPDTRANDAACPLSNFLVAFCAANRRRASISRRVVRNYRAIRVVGGKDRRRSRLCHPPESRNKEVRRDEGVKTRRSDRPICAREERNATKRRNRVAQIAIPTIITRYTLIHTRTYVFPRTFRPRVSRVADKN